MIYWMYLLTAWAIGLTLGYGWLCYRKDKDNDTLNVIHDIIEREHNTLKKRVETLEKEQW